MRGISLFVPAACASAALFALTATPATAQYVKRTTDGVVKVDVRHSATIFLPRSAKKVFVAAPDIADVDATTSNRIIVFGKKVGSTSVVISDAGGNEHSYVITVGRSVQQMLNAAEAAVPGVQVKIQDQPKGVMVTGKVASPAEAAALRAAIRGFLTDEEQLDFQVKMTGSVQVNLRVRIAEVSRRVSSSLGLNWGATVLDNNSKFGLLTGRAPITLTDSGAGAAPLREFSRSTTGDSTIGFNYRSPSGNTDIAALIDALKSRGLATILAEPNLTTSSGSRANFLAGGEFPVPMSTGRGDNAQITVEWKPFGVKVDFTPIVLDDDRMTIKVNSEVSELSSIGAVRVNNISIPSVSVRRVDTTVDLASGQSFAIAGLFKKNMGGSVSGLPGLGDLPILGALFRSKEFQRDESELVILVTPYIVRPVDRESDLRLPTDDVTPASDAEQIFLGKLTKEELPSPSSKRKAPDKNKVEKK